MKTVIISVCLLVLHLGRTKASSLLGIESDTGKLYSISTSNASLSLVGSTGVLQLSSLEMASDGFLYGFTNSATSTLYKIDPVSANAISVGPLGIGFIFEGSLAFSPGGIAYATNQNNSAAAALFTIDLTTGAATIVGTLNGGSHDINGMLWRSDGKLVGLDRVTASLIAINPVTAETSTISPITDATIGGSGGMAVVDNVAYFSTAGPGSSIPGSNELFSFDPFTGAHTRIGGFAPTVAGVGISGLAASQVPEPSAVSLLFLATFILFASKRLTMRCSERLRVSR